MTDESEFDKEFLQLSLEARRELDMVLQMMRQGELNEERGLEVMVKIAAHYRPKFVELRTHFNRWDVVS